MSAVESGSGAGVAHNDSGSVAPLPCRNSVSSDEG